MGGFLLSLRVFSSQILSYWKQIAAVLLVCVLSYGSYDLGATKTSELYETKIKNAGIQAAKEKAEFDNNQTYIIEQYAKWNVDHPVIKEVIKYVTTNSDAKCVIPVGFVRVFDAAASSQQIASGLDSNDTPSRATLSTVAETTVNNFEICNDTRQKFIALQNVIKAYQNSQIDK